MHLSISVCVCFYGLKAHVLPFGRKHLMLTWRRASIFDRC